MTPGWDESTSVTDESITAILAHAPQGSASVRRPSHPLSPVRPARPPVPRSLQLPRRPAMSLMLTAASFLLAAASAYDVSVQRSLGADYDGTSTTSKVLWEQPGCGRPEGPRRCDRGPGPRPLPARHLWALCPGKGFKLQAMTALTVPDNTTASLPSPYLPH